MNIKDMVKNKQVTFQYYREGELWYSTACGFNFPVPIADVGGASLMASDRAIMFMRWIRKHITMLQSAKQAEIS